MKKVRIILIISLFCTFTYLSAKQVIVQLQDEQAFKCELLYCSDSLLYVWTGFEDFNKEILKNDTIRNVHSFRISQLAKVILKIPKNFGESAITAFTSSLIAGSLITLLNFGDEDIYAVLMFNGFFNLVFGSGLTIILNFWSNIPNNITFDQTKDLYQSKRKLKQKCLLKNHLDMQLIQKLIQEIKPI
ncbi:MAG: hypothetical protein HQ534_13690 [Armatimonadetes bacterium]|nr:hypothetical protein [Armatimonadota bacterium]